MHYEVTQQQLNALLSYLINQPYKETVQLINMLQNLPKNDGKEEVAVKEDCEDPRCL